MAVHFIEEFRQKDGVDILKVHLKPTKSYPLSNYFYCNAEDIDLVESFTWCKGTKTKPYIIYNTSNLSNKFLYFHKEIVLKHNEYLPAYVDHINGIEYDNIHNNIYVVTNTQNLQNKFSIGYSYVDRDKFFNVIYCLNYNVFSKYVKTEYAAARYRLEIEKLHYSNRYLIEEARRDNLEILDLERTGVVSHEEGIKMRLEPYKENAWYYHRFGLEDWFKNFNWGIPDFDLDENGFMRHKITGQYLCPKWKGGS